MTEVMERNSEAFDGDNLLKEDTQKDRYLTFQLAEENYGLDIGDVIEIIGIQKITKVPDMPPFIKGVINLRGQVIPVMDMRFRFQLPPQEYDDRTCIVVTEVAHKTMGVVVDRVNEVVDIPESQVAPPRHNRRDLSAVTLRAWARSATIFVSCSIRKRFWWPKRTTFCSDNKQSRKGFADVQKHETRI